MKTEIKIDKQKNIAIVKIEIQKRILLKEPKVRISKEIALSELKTKFPDLEVSQVLNDSYCSNLLGEPSIGIWEFILVENKKKKIELKNKEVNLDRAIDIEQSTEKT